MMKKVLMVIAAAMVFAACEKKEECKSCKIVTKVYYNDEIDESMTQEVEYGKVCGDALEAVDGQTTDSKTTVGDMTMVTETVYICK